jgi:hypothetical protein
MLKVIIRHKLSPSYEGVFLVRAAKEYLLTKFDLVKLVSFLWNLNNNAGAIQITF